ncbi:hypothetical protein J6590_086750 [Homalodisca vitripennis]|nr:hypothetical protein J6590_086750 [Homalodisca vitripennis]
MPLPVLPDTSATDELTRRVSSLADCEWNCCVYVVKLVFDILGRCVVCTRNGLRNETIYVCETCTARPNLHPDTSSKLNLGIPTFGRSWELTTESPISGVPPLLADGAGDEGTYSKIKGTLAYYETTSSSRLCSMG